MANLTKPADFSSGGGVEPEEADMEKGQGIEGD
jgi:hypothetical protein